MPASPIRRLAPLAAEARRRGLVLHPLNIGQPDLPTPPQILDRLREFQEPNLAYGPSQGLPEFIETLRCYHSRIGLDVGQEEIFVTTGGSEALLFILAAIADHGDEVLVFEPFYTNYSGFAHMIGVNAVPVTTRADDGYRLPAPEEIERRIGPRTRAILLCSPNNPTGTVYTVTELEALAEICRRRDLFLVADEVYREFVYDSNRHVSAWALDGIADRVIIADSLSKRVSMCGARIGWILTRNQMVLSALLRFGQARLCPPTLGQYLGTALESVPAAYIQGVVNEYQKRRDLVFDSLAAIPRITVRRPEGAFYLCPRLPIDDTQRFAEFLLSDFSIDGESVIVAPADGFYATPGLGRDEVRLAYVIDRSRLSRAMRILVEGLAAYERTRTATDR